MRVLVAGGAGYIGSHVVRALAESGHEPIVYDNLSTGHREAVSGEKFYDGDVRDRDTLSKVLREEKPDGAIHLAAFSQVGESMKFPSKYFDNNISGGLAFFDALVSAEVPWVVFSSTAAVYGDPAEVPIRETQPTVPANPYGESKLALERMLRWYDHAYGMKSTALRYFNAAGAHPAGTIGEDHQPESHLVPIVLQAALGVRPNVTVFGTDYATNDGTAVRDYVHVCDLAQAHIQAMLRLSSGGQSGAYNLGSERGYSVAEVISMAREVTRRDIPVMLGDRRAGDPPTLVACSEVARADLGWVPAFDLEGIIATAWQWHSQHPNGYRQ